MPCTRKFYITLVIICTDVSRNCIMAMNCLKTVLVLAMCNLIAGQCPSRYGGTWLKCPTDVANSRDMNVGEEIHCTCNTNCAPVTAKCEVQGVGRKAWKFDKTLCHPSRNYTSKTIPGLDANLLVSYQANKGHSFECSTGYKLNRGNGQVVTAANCLAGTLNINPIPKCDKIECTTLPNDVSCDGENVTTSIFGETKLCTCKFNCFKINITCGRANEWTKETTVCEDREYRDKTAADSNLKYSLMNGNYTFKCINGRGLQGSPIIVCKDGKLSDSLPTCVRKCNKRGSRYLKFINTRTEAFVGDEAQSVCLRNCMPVKATCNSLGQWDYNSSICQASRVPPAKVPNYDPHVLVSYSNQKYSVSCEMGYSLRKNITTAKCNRGDLMLTPRPICVLTEMYRLKIGLLIHSILITDLEQQCTQKPADLRCDNFKMTNRGGTMECTCLRNCMPVTLTCEHLGQWTYDSSTCKGDEVTLKGSDENLLVSFASANYLFSCVIGFSLHGAEIASCTDGTLALNPSPVCRKQCLEIPNEIRCLSNSEEIRNFGSKMNCTCKNNCAPVMLTCGESGSWDYEATTCKNNNMPVWVQNNDIHLHVTFIAPEYLFMCDEGYILHGVDKANCSNGELQFGSQPYCVAEPMCIDSPLDLTCLDFDVGKVGDEINCTCNSNCLSLTVTCDQAGQWDYNGTICTENEKWMTHESHGLIMTFTNGAIHFKCVDELMMIGDATASCINGTFDKEFPHCDNVDDEAYLFGGLRQTDATLIGIVLIGLLLGFTIGGISFCFYRRRVKSRQNQPSLLIAYSRDRRGNEHSSIIGTNNCNEFQNCNATSNDCHSNASTSNCTNAVVSCGNKYVTFDELAAQRAAAKL